MQEKHSKTVTYETEFVKRMQCDICKREVLDRDSWSNKYFDVEETTVQYRTGHIFPEGDFTTCYEFDICPECFESKLIPFIEGFGCKVRERDAE